MTDEELEAPAYLGRAYPAAPVPAAPGVHGRRLDSLQVLDMLSDDRRRDRSLGYLVMLSAILVVGALAYAGEGWWLFAALCGVGGAVSTYGAVRRVRRRVREELEMTLTEPGTSTRRGSAPG